LVWKKLNLTRQKHAFTNQKKCRSTQNTHKKLKPDLVAFYETEWVYSQKKILVREEISKEKMKKKDKQGSIRYKQANNIYSTEIKN